jgi:hypothetical protein
VALPVRWAMTLAAFKEFVDDQTGEERQHRKR